MSVTDVSGLSQLGTKVDTPESPEKAVLEKVPNGNAGTDYVVRFTAPEFTSLCPMTGQRLPSGFVRVGSWKCEAYMRGKGERNFGPTSQNRRAGIKRILHPVNAHKRQTEFAG